MSKKSKKKDKTARDEVFRRTEHTCSFCLSEGSYFVSIAIGGTPSTEGDYRPRQATTCIFCLGLLQYLTDGQVHWGYAEPTFSPRDGAAAVRVIEEMLLAGRRDIPGPERH